MKKQILIDRAEKGYLQKLFDCTNVMVWKALTFESDSDLAKRIRKAAVERGGVLTGVKIPQNKVIELETTYQTAEKTMTQTFGTRVKIIVYTKQNLTVVLVDDQVKMKQENLSIPEFMKLQNEVKRIAAEL